jgi:hypothetical protein
MKKLDYHWLRDPKGQFVDRHEWENVVNYCQNIFHSQISKQRPETGHRQTSLYLHLWSAVLSCGSMMSQHFMQIIVVCPVESTRMRLRNHMWKERVLHRWSPILYLLTMAGYALLMGRRKLECCLKLEKNWEGHFMNSIRQTKQ